ncbi:type IV pilus secretin PilQ [Candidatus Glomeribacter gigasporarum]|uniref:type IV pilus secretin PilQ n=1 Tax=Candidatus Glomeribacter gigasporarum TaxID=132144 RepID=UPI0002E00BF7|nr:type IV pilus secretin PilQ [Candidatus Glomeribacter gigasporarum]
MKNALVLITLIIAMEAVASEAALKPPLPMILSARAENKGKTERADRIPALPEGSLVPLAPPERLSGVPGKTSGARTDEGEPISLEFHHAELTAVLQAFADFTGLNIIASERVRGAVSLRLDKVPWRRAFDALLDSQGLAMQRHGNVIWVAPAEELAMRERQRLETHARAAGLEPLASRLFELNYQRAEEVRKLLTGAGAQRVLSKRGAAIADPRTNQLFVTDLAARIEQIQDMLKAIDRPLRQVAIEARIVEAEEGFARALGARLSMLGASKTKVSRGLLGAQDGALYDLPAGPLGLNAATVGWTLFGVGANRVLALELSALEADGRGRILSSPRVVTADRVKALVEQGTELPYQAKVGTGVSGVQFRRAGLKLEVTPNITPDGHVMLDVDITKDSVGAQTISGPAINTKHVQTQVQVEDGGTVSIGGIFMQDERVDVTGVPWLRQLPLIGALFRHSKRARNKSELLVFITPNIVAKNP